jgi:hypothetical protein
MIIGLCDRFHCLPSQLMEEDLDIIRLLKIVALGSQQEEGGEFYGERGGNNDNW